MPTMFSKIQLTILLLATLVVHSPAIADDPTPAKKPPVRFSVPAEEYPAVGVPVSEVWPEGFVVNRNGLRPPFWQPGGYEARIGSPYYYSAVDYGAIDGYSTDVNQYSPNFGVDRFGVDWGSPWIWSGYGQAGYVYGDEYTNHFGPGYYRHFDHGYYRFPYYTYRSPWYFPGHAVYSRDTNFAW